MKQFVVASSIFPKFVKLNIWLAETSLVRNFKDQLIKNLILMPYKTSHSTCWAFPNNPVFISVTQEDTGLKEGRFSLARSSQRTFPYDQKRIRRSSSLYTDSSENLSRNSSISMSTLISSLSVDLSRTASSVSTSTSIISDDNVPNYGACSNSKRQGRYT